MKALVTGSSGFIGSNLCKRLLENGYEVLGIDPNENSIQDENFQFFSGRFTDLLDDSLIEFIDKDTSVFHLGATKNKNVEIVGIKELFESNVNDFSKLLEFSDKKKVKKLIFTSSLYVYGTKNYGPFYEDSLLAPESYYGISKLIGEKLVEDFHKKSNITSYILRLFFIYGSGQKTEQSNYYPVIDKTMNNLLNDKNPTIYGDGQQTLDFVFIDDLTDLLCDDERLIKNNNLSIYNVSSSKETSINELVKIITEKLNINLEPKYLEKDWTNNTRRFGSNDKIMNDLNWAPKIDLNKGLDKCIKFL